MAVVFASKLFEQGGVLEGIGGGNMLGGGLGDGHRGN